MKNLIIALFLVLVMVAFAAGASNEEIVSVGAKPLTGGDVQVEVTSLYLDREFLRVFKSSGTLDAATISAVTSRLSQRKNIVTGQVVGINLRFPDPLVGKQLGVCATEENSTRCTWVAVAPKMFLIDAVGSGTPRHIEAVIGNDLVFEIDLALGGVTVKTPTMYPIKTAVAEIASSVSGQPTGGGLSPDYFPNRVILTEVMGQSRGRR